MSRFLVGLGGGMCRSADGTPSCSERAALALAIRRLGADIDACLLRDDDDLRRYALAAGARSVRVWRPSERLKFDVAILGSELHPWGERLAAEWALEQDAALVFDVLDIEPRDGGFCVLRRLEAGERERLRVNAPAVLCVAAEAEHRLYISRYRRRMAGEGLASFHAQGRLVEPVHDDLDEWQPTRPRVRSEPSKVLTHADADQRLQAAFGMDDASAVSASSSGPIVADPATCAAHLLRYLRHHGFLLPAGDVAIDESVMPSMAERPPAEARRIAPRESPIVARLRVPRPLDPARLGPRRWPQREAAAAALPVKWCRAPRPLGGGPPKRRPQPLTTVDSPLRTTTSHG